jgi:hypothetical protein
VRTFVPRVAHDADPAGRPGQRVAQLLPQLLAVVVGDDDVREPAGQVVVQVGEAPNGCLSRRHPGGVGLDQHGAEAEVGAVAEQERRHRRGEDGDQQTVGRRGVLGRPVRHPAVRIGAHATFSGLSP